MASQKSALPWLTITRSRRFSHELHKDIPLFNVLLRLLPATAHTKVKLEISGKTSRFVPHVGMSTADTNAILSQPIEKVQDFAEISTNPRVAMKPPSAFHPKTAIYKTQRRHTAKWITIRWRR